jgi:hypothetical protein
MLGSSKWSLSLRFPTKTLSSPSSVLHALPISFSVWSPEQYWVSSTDQ